MKIRLLVLVLFCLAPPCLGMAQADTIAVKPVKKPAGYTSRINVVYTVVAGWKGRMDIYLPPAAGRPSPLLINIHGGAWTHGNKESQTGFYSFFKKGFAVANIEYRMSPVAPAPAAIQDTRCALMYLVRHAARLNLDTRRIVVMGASAGGHLALMTGLLGHDHRFDQDCPHQDDFRIAAIIDKYGPTDLSILKSLEHIHESAYAWLGDKVHDPAFLRAVSPLYYVQKNSPPVFIVHGDSDPTVPYRQSVLLHDKLEAEGVKNEFVTVPGGLHGKFSPDEKAKVSRDIINFITAQGIVN
jgi:acetyl esterase/lipase